MSGFLSYVFLGVKPKRSKKKKSFQGGGGYESYRLRKALKDGNYKTAHVHRLFGKNFTT